MAHQKDKSVVLLPIRPIYVKEILEGRKKVEFRRRAFSREVDRVVIYATSPVKKVVGTYHLNRIVQGCPQDIWTKYKRVGGISQRDYFNYFADTNSSFALEIDRGRILSDPIPLSVIESGMMAPQSFRYLSNEQISKIDRLPSRMNT